MSSLFADSKHGIERLFASLTDTSMPRIEWGGLI